MRLATLSLFIDGRRDSQCDVPKAALALPQDVASLTALFSLGGYCGPDVLSSPANCFVGFLDGVRLWSVPRNEQEFRTYLYKLPSGSIPGLVVDLNFDSGDDPSLSRFLFWTTGCCAVVPYSRRLSQTHVYLTSIPQYQTPEYTAPTRPGGQGAAPPPPVNPPTLPPAGPGGVDPEIIAIWHQYARGMITCMHDSFVGSGVTDPDLLEFSISDMLGDPQILGIAGTFSTMSLEGKLNGPIPDPANVIKSIEAGPVLQGAVPGAFIINPETLLRQAALLYLEIRKRGYWPCVTGACGVGFDSYSTKRLNDTLNLWMKDSVAETKLAVCFAVKFGELRDHIRALKDGLESATGAKKKSMPVLAVYFDGKTVGPRTEVPVRVEKDGGGQGQPLEVQLFPPARGGPCTVSITTTDPAINTDPTELVFPDGDIDRQSVTVRATSLRTTKLQPRVLFRTDRSPASSAVAVLIDEKEQNLILAPTQPTLSDQGEDSFTLLVTYAAILDEGQMPEVKLTDETSSDEDPLPSKMLRIEPDVVPFARVRNDSHMSLVGYVTVSLVDKPAGTPSGTPSRGPGRVLLQEKRKRKTVLATDPEDRKKRSRVTIDFAQTVTITMVQAGKGDCFIISETVNRNTSRLLIDGGIKGTWKNHLQPTLTRLGANWLRGVNCTHFDDDHINGM